MNNATPKKDLAKQVCPSPTPMHVNPNNGYLCTADGVAGAAREKALPDGQPRVDQHQEFARTGNRGHCRQDVAIRQRLALHSQPGRE